MNRRLLSGRLFWLLSRSALAIYSRFPIFGMLTAAVGIVKSEGKYLVIDRNDGRGISFPGGLRHSKELPEATMRREVEEETGLSVREATLLVRYRNSDEVPVEIHAFEVKADGDLRDSWEGTPKWMRLDEMHEHMLPSQKPILNALSGLRDSSDASKITQQ